MGQKHHLPRFFALWCMIGTLVVILAGPESVAATDPVEELWRALLIPVSELPQYDSELAKRMKGLTAEEQNKVLLQARDRLLAKRVNDLRSLPDIRRALRLYAWPDFSDPQQAADIERRYHAELVERFERQFRRVLRDGTVARRLAALAMLNEEIQFRDPLVQWKDPTSGKSLGVVLTADVVALIKRDQAAEVRAAAARALGKMNPDLEKALPAFEGLLDARDISERRAAAQGLGDLVQQTQKLADASRNQQTDNGASRSELLQLGRSVLPIAAKGIRDADAAVRRLCLEAIRQTAVTVSYQIPQVHIEPNYSYRYEQMGLDPQGIARTLDALRPIVQVIHDQLPRIIPALSDGEMPVSLAAHQALEAIGTVRSSLLGLSTELAKFNLGEGVRKPAEDSLGQGLQAAVPGLTTLLAHQDVRIRLASLYVLETFESLAAPAAKEVVAALGDSDSYVRWAAVRVLGKMAPAAAEQAVPALAQLVDKEKNLDVRLTTVAALERYGHATKAAAPALGRVVSNGPVAMRSLAIKALAAIGTGAQPAVPQLIAALSAPEASLRAEAVQALGKIAPMAQATMQALQKALNDPDEGVRQAASDALLAGE